MDRDGLNRHLGRLHGCLPLNIEWESDRNAILAEFDRLTEEMRGESALVYRLQGYWIEECAKYNRVAATLERIVQPLRKFSTEELRRHNPYLPHDDAEHGTLWTIIERICDYLDSQGKDSQQKPFSGGVDCHACKPKDEEVLRGIPSEAEIEDFLYKAMVWRTMACDLHAFLEHFQLKESTTTKTVSTWTE